MTTSQADNESKATKPWYKNIWIWAAVAVLLVIGGVGNALGVGDDSSSPAPEPTAESITLPDVVGLDGAAARDALTELGAIVEFDAGEQTVVMASNWNVDSQLPIAGSSISTGETIVLSVSKGAADGEEADGQEPLPDDATRSLELEESIKLSFGGVESFSDIYASDPTLWAGYINGVRVEGARAYITLQIGNEDPNRDELGTRAAGALSKLLPTSDVRGISWIIVEDASGIEISDSRI